MGLEFIYVPFVPGMSVNINSKKKNVGHNSLLPLFAFDMGYEPFVIWFFLRFQRSTGNYDTTFLQFLLLFPLNPAMHSL